MVFEGFAFGRVLFKGLNLTKMGENSRKLKVEG